MDEQFLLEVTYSFEDDKLRIYLTERLPPDIWQTLKKAGYRWAPKQELLYAVWNPHREDFALAFAGDGGIGLEMTSMEDRAADRAARFAQYSSNAGQRAASARDRVKSICDRIPPGQPILVGHHSEAAARADQRRIEGAQRLAVKEWGKESHWQDRSQAVLAHVRRLKSPQVIYNRVDRLEAELRKHKAAVAAHTWDEKQQKVIHTGKDAALYEWSGVEQWTQESLARFQDHRERWINHLEARLAYNRALYDVSGGILADRQEIKVGDYVLAWGDWMKVLRVNNKRQGGISSYSCESGHSWPNKIKPSHIRDHKTAEEMT